MKPRRDRGEEDHPLDILRIEEEGMVSLEDFRPEFGTNIVSQCIPAEGCNKEEWDQDLDIQKLLGSEKSRR